MAGIWRRHRKGDDLAVDDPTVCPLDWEDIYAGRTPVEQALIAAVAAVQEIMQVTLPRPGPNARAHAEQVLLLHRHGLAAPGQNPDGGLLQAIYQYLVMHIGDAGGDPRRLNLAAEGVKLAQKLVPVSDDYRLMIPAQYLLLAEALVEFGRYDEARRFSATVVPDLTMLRRWYPQHTPAAIVAATRARRRLAALT